jgi:hypothetical protein
MQKQYFQLDLVHSITLNYETKTSYKWYAEVPARPRIFLGIPFGMTKAIPAGWSEYDEPNRTTPSSYFDGYDWYRVDEVNKKVFNKARVDIRFSYKEGIGVQFDSNEEAEKYVNELVESSNKKFTVIINK